MSAISMPPSFGEDICISFKRTFEKILPFLYAKIDKIDQDLLEDVIKCLDLWKHNYYWSANEVYAYYQYSTNENASKAYKAMDRAFDALRKHGERRLKNASKELFVDDIISSFRALHKILEFEKEKILFIEKAKNNFGVDVAVSANHPGMPSSFVPIRLFFGECVKELEKELP